MVQKFFPASRHSSNVTTFRDFGHTSILDSILVRWKLRSLFTSKTDLLAQEATSVKGVDYLEKMIKEGTLVTETWPPNSANHFGLGEYCSTPKGDVVLFGDAHR